MFNFELLIEWMDDGPSHIINFQLGNHGGWVITGDYPYANSKFLIQNLKLLNVLMFKVAIHV